MHTSLSVSAVEYSSQIFPIAAIYEIDNRDEIITKVSLILTTPTEPEPGLRLKEQFILSELRFSKCRLAGSRLLGCRRRGLID